MSHVKAEMHQIPFMKPKFDSQRLSVRPSVRPSLRWSVTLSLAFCFCSDKSRKKIWTLDLRPEKHSDQNYKCIIPRSKET